MGEVSTREVLQELADSPIGDRHLHSQEDEHGHIRCPEAIEAAKRANHKWLPGGKRSTNGPEVRARRQAFYERQVDLEDAVEAAGGQRGGKVE